MVNVLNFSVNFFIVALVIGGYRADIIIIGDSKFYVFVLTLLSYLLTNWLRFFCFFVCSGTEVVGLVKLRNFYLIFAILIALFVNFFILILLQLLSNLNSKSDSSFRVIYRGNLLIYSRTVLSLLSYFFLISSFAIDLNWWLYELIFFSPRVLWVNVVR